MKKTRRIGYVFHTPETESSVFKCPYCSKEYKTQEGLEKHIADKHGDVTENTSGNTPEE